MEGLNVLPLAVTMVAGPQIISALVLTTAPRPVRISLHFLAGVLLATCVGLSAMRGLAALVGSVVDLGGSGDGGSTGRIIQYVVVGLLVLLALRNWVGRRTSEPPRWLGTLMSAGPMAALRIGFLVILLMPSDLMVMLTVGIHLEQSGAPLTAALPFAGLTLLLAALPLLLILLFHRRARTVMPRVRDWTNTHSWLINIGVCALFVVLVVG